MNTRTFLAAAGLAAVALAGPALGQVKPTRDVGPRYVVINQTGEAVNCRYRVNSGNDRNWHVYGAIAAGGQLTLRSKVPGETMTVDCMGDTGGGKLYTVRPGSTYRAYRNQAGEVTVGELGRTAANN